MKAFVLTKNRTEKFYYAFFQQKGLINKFYKGSMRQYKFHLPFLKRLFPFSCLQPGQVAIQAGFRLPRISRGISHPLILSVIVGQRGKVIAVDPVKNDSVEIVFDKLFGPERNQCNITFVQRAVWKEKGKLNLIDRKLEPIYYERYKDALEGTVEVNADNLKNIMDEYAPNTDYINLTINGSEGAAILGMKEYITKNISIAFALATRWLGKDGIRPIDELAKKHDKERQVALQMLYKNGYTLLIGDVTPRRNFGHFRDGTRWPFWHALALKDKDMIERMLRSHRHMEIDLSDGWPKSPTHVLNSPCKH